MTLSPSQRNELRDLIDIACESDSDSSALDRLESLLLADDDACRYYLDYASLHGALILSAEKKTDEVAGEWRGEGRGKRGERRVERGEGREVSKSLPNQQISNAALPVSIILDTSPAPLSSPTSPFYVAHPFMFSNLFAILVISLGVLGAWLYQVDIPQTIAHHDRPANALGKSVKSVDADSLEFVGRVTGMVDVQWADVQTATVSGANVPLGRRYALSSGLMEITYDTGAKVILQGPVTYQVESRAGGFLSIGKLTARLEKSAEGREESQEKQSAISGQQSEKAASGQSLVTSETNSKSQIAKSQILSPVPQFTVRTPTATVTDLGTEFGVEVFKEGTAHVAVFAGEVVASANGVEGTAGTVHLKAGQSAGIDKTKITLNQKTSLEAQRFVRKLEKPVAGSLVHLWTFDDDFKDAVGTAHGVAVGKPTLHRGILGHNALQLSDQAYIELPYFRPDLHFTVSGWINTTASSAEALEIMGWGGLARSAQFRVSNGLLQYGDFTDGWLGVSSKSTVSNGQWRHVAMVRDYEHVRLYVDGIPEGEGTTHAMQLQEKLSIGADLADLGAGYVALYLFEGSIDDLGYWRTALPEARVSAIHQLGIHPALRYGQKQAVELFSLFTQRQGEINIEGKIWRYRGDLPEGKPGAVVDRADGTILLYLDKNAGVSTSMDSPSKEQR